MKKLTLALDWTPNINHIGFYVAQEKGFYKAFGVEMDIIDPSMDNYAVTPAKKVEIGDADCALCPTESIISYRTKSNPCDMVAIAAVLQKDLSAIVVKSDSGITSPKDLDGKSYASYQARYEDGIVKQMIKNDGGKGDIQIAYPEKLGIWDTLLENKFDSTWVFMNWEGVAANNLNTNLRYFQMEDYGIPYSYSPVIAARASKVLENSESYRAFIEASRKGFLYCKENPAEAVKILKSHVPQSDAHLDLSAALAASVDAFGNAENWGSIDPRIIQEFLDFIYGNDLESKKVIASDLFTTECLAKSE